MNIFTSGKSKGKIYYLIYLRENIFLSIDCHTPSYKCLILGMLPLTSNCFHMKQELTLFLRYREKTSLVLLRWTVMP